MNLFAPDPTANLLPRDGVVHYHGPVLSPAQAREYFERLLADIPWKGDEVVVAGRRIVTARQVAWYGDSSYRYTYSGTTKTALPWTPELLELKERVEACSGEHFNSCLLNLYASGAEGMAWHSDDEPALARHAAIASLSLGAERTFTFRHKLTGEKCSLELEDGSLLVMAGSTQTHWQHCLPKTRKVAGPRINLTFRTVVMPTR
jgi:alkylated DNA repair dioxygenase AlkB